MRVLGLDLATVSGWSHIEVRGMEWVPIRWGRMDCSPPPKSDEPEGVRFRRLADALPRILKGVDAAAIEQTFSSPKMKRAGEILNGLVAVALVELERHGIEYIFVPPAKWKAHLMLGRTRVVKGAHTKREVREALNGWAGVIEPGTSLKEDEADALGIGKWFTDVHMQRHLPDIEF